MNTRDRLIAIADALETASKQARLLADEIGDDRTVTMTVTDFGTGVRKKINRLAGVQAMRDNQQACQE